MKKTIISLITICLTAFAVSAQTDNERAFQLGFISPLGTNGIQSGQVVNYVSINLLGGYSKGNKAFELGGLYNINTSYTQGLQIAGIANWSGYAENALQIGGVMNVISEGSSVFQLGGVFNKGCEINGAQIGGVVNMAGNVRGLQLGGVSNVSGDVTGLQLGGIVNVSNDVAGVQIGGAVNVSDDVAGLQIGGVVNVSDNVDGFQLGGAVNVADNMSGFQLGGIANVADEMRGFQLGGVANVAGSMHGFQLGGIVNIAGSVNGFQLGGVVNVTKKLRGFQFGVVNYADEVDGGVAFGIINIVRKGGKQEFEVSFSEAVNAAVSFKLGTDRLYTIFSAGTNFYAKQVEYAVGLGFGTHFDWKKGWGNQVELMYYSLTEQGSFRNLNMNMLTQLRLTFSKEFAPHFKVFAGPVLNMTISSYVNPQTGVLGSSLAPYSIWKNSGDKVRLNGWIGGIAGVRF